MTKSKLTPLRGCFWGSDGKFDIFSDIFSLFLENHGYFLLLLEHMGIQILYLLSSLIHHYRSLPNYNDFRFWQPQKCEKGPISGCWSSLFSHILDILFFQKNNVWFPQSSSKKKKRSGRKLKIGKICACYILYEHQTSPPDPLYWFKPVYIRGLYLITGKGGQTKV